MKRQPLTESQRRRRKRWLVATLVTCVTLAMVGGSLHVMKLGSMRMDEMRAKATYDVADMNKHIRAAGEEIYLQESNEKMTGDVGSYTRESAQALLRDEQWEELESMVSIPAGVFEMGSDDPKTNETNRPMHKVMVRAYKIDKYPVTQAQYARFIASRHYRLPLNWDNGQIPRGMAMHPVTMVSWYNARDYCGWAGKRLPTEAEWEKAARGEDGRRWPWGNRMNPTFLNTYDRVGSTTPVEQYAQAASPYGVVDMAGNVQEWVADEFAAYPGSTASDQVFAAKDIDPNYQRGSEETEELIFRVMRGGSWKSDPFSTTTYHRNYSLPNYASDFYGFRCAKSEDREQEAK